MSTRYQETPFVLDDGRFEPAAGQPESKPVVQHVIDTTLSQPARTNGEALGALTLQRDSVREPPVAESDDDSMAETSRTDDDPVGDAFREALNGSDGKDEDDQDEIVWNLGCVLASLHRAPTYNTRTVLLPVKSCNLFFLRFRQDALNHPVLWSPHSVRSVYPRICQSVDPDLIGPQPSLRRLW